MKLKVLRKPCVGRMEGRRRRGRGRINGGEGSEGEGRNR